MNPLSPKSRTIYLTLLVLIFFIAAPLLILYSRGYRFGEAFKIFATGGLYIRTAQSGTDIYINGELARETNLFQKNILIQNLKPANYSIRVVKPGFQEWTKTLPVFAETVTEANTFMLPNKIEITEVLPLISSTIGTATNTNSGSLGIGKDNPEYLSVVNLFKAPTATSTTRNLKVFRNLSVANKNGRLEVQWEGSPESKPTYFCIEDVCKDVIIINPSGKLLSFDFFPGREDLIVLGLDNGIFVTEIDNRSGQNVQKIIEGSGIDFRIMNGNIIYLKMNNRYYSVSL